MTSIHGLVNWVCGFITFLPWTVFEKLISIELKNYLLNMTARMRSKQISNSPDAPYRCVENIGGLLNTIYADHRTMDSVFEYSAQKFSDSPCLGTRELLIEEDEKQPDGKVFKKAIFGEYKWQSYNQVYYRILNLSRGLALTGLQPSDKVAIFLETRAEWFIAVQACFRNSFPVITVYATLGEDGIQHALNETECTHVITSATLINTKLKNCLHNIATIAKVVYVEDCKLHNDINVPDTVQLHTFAEIEKLGLTDQGKQYKRNKPKPDDLAVIMYTSGQSGDPKGVLINHANMVSAMSAITTRIPNLSRDDTYIAYLPLAHVLELVAEHTVCAGGARIGYSSPLTLSDRSSRIKKGSSGDATVLKPTLMAAVPEILERMRKAVMQNVNEMSSVRRNVFSWAYEYKLRQVERGYDTPFLNRLIFKKTRALLGGQVRAMLSGAAPMNVQTQRFMNVCMCCPVGQGYGLTETCGATTVSQVLEDFSTGRVGPPLPCCEVKLVEWEEGGYSPTNKPNPQGEVHVGGPNITMGYFKKPEKTAEDFYVDENGQRWFKTGDIGQMDADGVLRIIDRKKDLVKLSHGEYISLGTIESKLKASPLIDNVWIYGNGTKAYALAFVVPNENGVRSIASNQGMEETDFVLLCKKESIVKEIEKAIADTAKISHLQKFEIPQKVFIDPKPWLPEDGLTTASFKLKRKALESHYKNEIRALYV